MSLLTNLAPIAAALADLAGVVALALSAYVFFASRRDRRPRLTVSVGEAEGEYEPQSNNDDPYYGPESFHIAYVDVANPCDRRIKVASMAVERARRRGPFNKERLPLDHDQFQSERKPPFFLHPGDGLSFTTEFDEFDTLA